MGIRQSLQPSPVRDVIREMNGITRSPETLLISLLNEAPKTTPTVSFITSSLKANLL